MQRGSMTLKQNSAVSVYIGIASLVLEGRVIGTDEDDDDAFSMKFESQSLNDDAGLLTGETHNTSGSSTSHHGAIHRISEKLMRLRQFPGSKEIVETSLAIPVQSRDDYERQPRLHHVASTREFPRNARLTTVPPSFASNSTSSAASVLHDIDVDWNDISILFNGLDSLNNISRSPIKLSANHAFHHHPIPMHLEPSLSIFKTKEKNTGKTKLKPKQGPHCEKFLKKIGIMKVDPTEPDNHHMCNHANGYVSFICLKLS